MSAFRYYGIKPYCFIYLYYYVIEGHEVLIAGISGMHDSVALHKTSIVAIQIYAEFLNKTITMDLFAK